jgi:hypothetical protein
MRYKRALAKRIARNVRTVAVMCVLLTGCVNPSGMILSPKEAFPPQNIIDNGGYKNFLADNQRTLAQCGGRAGCDMTLFNLGFVYAYPPSPYRDPQKARHYLNELQNQYPRSPWTTQGRVLLAFMNEQVSAEESQRRLRTELRNRDAVIRKLREQLNRSREIDIEMEKIERDLLR